MVEADWEVGQEAEQTSVHPGGVKIEITQHRTHAKAVRETQAW